MLLCEQASAVIEQVNNSEKSTMLHYSSSNPCETPLLLIIWRRPYTLRQLIDAIRPIAPIRLFVACDGPNPNCPDESEKVTATRSVIEHEIDWPCHIERLYSESNQGCRLGVSRAISWFFEHVEEGIILEDDCIPHLDFFPYCTTLLKRYRHDERVWSICGSNFQLGHRRGSASYYFSIHGDSWGWATWKRAWANYPEAEKQWSVFRDSGRLEDIFPIPQEQKYWREILDCLFIEGQPNTWDYQWWLASWMNNGLHAWPNACLVSNAGFGGEGTHTFGNSLFAALELETLGEITHPKFILPSRDADEFAFLHRREGLRKIEQDRYGWRYSWVLRARQLRREGLLHYAGSRLYRRIPFIRQPT